MNGLCIVIAGFIIKTSLYISNHELMQLRSIQEAATQIFGPLLLIGIGLVIVIVSNLYLLNKMHSCRSNRIYRALYLCLNLVILLNACYQWFGMSSYSIEYNLHLYTGDSKANERIHSRDSSDPVVNFFNEQCNHEESLIWKLDLRFLQASKLLCSDRCACTEEQAEKSQYRGFGLYNNNKKFAHKIQDCYFYTITKTLEGFEDLASRLEEHYQCSGVCQKINKFLFSEDNQPVQSSCISALTQDYLRIKSNLDLCCMTLMWSAILSILIEFYMQFIPLNELKCGTESNHSSITSHNLDDCYL